ncbi:hypothetical protein ACJX0J_034571, partial [Zea mays]
VLAVLTWLVGWLDGQLNSVWLMMMIMSTTCCCLIRFLYIKKIYHCRFTLNFCLTIYLALDYYSPTLQQHLGVSCLRDLELLVEHLYTHFNMFNDSDP